MYHVFYRGYQSVTGGHTIITYHKPPRPLPHHHPPKTVFAVTATVRRVNAATVVVIVALLLLSLSLLLLLLFGDKRVLSLWSGVPSTPSFGGETPTNYRRQILSPDSPLSPPCHHYRDLFATEDVVPGLLSRAYVCLYDGYNSHHR